MSLLSGNKLHALIGGNVAWVNRRDAGMAYRYHSKAQNNGITMVLTGEARYVINGNTYILSPGRMSFLSAGDDLEITAIGKTSFSFLVLNFTLFDLNGAQVRLSDLHFPFAGEPKRLPSVRNRMLHLLKEFHGHAADKTARLSAGILQLLCEINEGLSARASGKNPAGDVSPGALERAAEYAYRNLNRKITLHDLARQACLNASYFSRLFRKATGETPMEFIRGLKIARAGTVLLNSDLSIGQVSEMFGFQSQAHFSRKFRIINGMSPMAFVKKNKGR